MVHSGRRRLNPLQPALAHDAVPIDRRLGVSAEDVGGKKLFGDALLAGVDDFGLRHSGGDLLDVSWLDGVTEDDSHKYNGGWVVN